MSKRNVGVSVRRRIWDGEVNWTLQERGAAGPNMDGGNQGMRYSGSCKSCPILRIQSFVTTAATHLTPSKKERPGGLQSTSDRSCRISDGLLKI
jgi:hypothetical protein